MLPGLLPIFLHGCEIKSGWGLGTRLGKAYVEKFEEVSEVQTPHQMRCIAFLSRTKVGPTPLQPRTRSARTLGTINYVSVHIFM